VAVQVPLVAVILYIVVTVGDTGKKLDTMFPGFNV
jgi:hypothetical protein